MERFWAVLAGMAVLLAVPLAAAYPDLTEYGKSRQVAAQEMLDNAMESFGRDAAGTIQSIRDPNDTLFRGGELYTFVVDGNGTVLAHGAVPSAEGRTIHDVVDPRGVNLGDLLRNNASPYGKWIEYHWMRPSAGLESVGLNLAWVKTGWGHTFGTGIYLDSIPDIRTTMTERDYDRLRIAKGVVERATSDYDRDPARTVSAIHDMDDVLYRHDEIFAFIISYNGTILAHGAMPDLEGTDANYVTDILGNNLGELFEENRSPYGTWVEYYQANPTSGTGNEELSVLWVKAHAGHMFAAGMFPESPDSTQDTLLSWWDLARQDLAWDVVDAAISGFGTDLDGTISGIHDADNRLYRAGDIRVMVVDGSGVVVAHGGDPDTVGMPAADFGWGDVVDSATPYGEWTGYDSDVLTLARSAGGYVFLAEVRPEFLHDTEDDITESDRQRQRLAQNMADAAAAAFAGDVQSAISAIHDMDNRLYHDGTMYVVVSNIHNGTIVAHGESPDLAGSDMHDVMDYWGVNVGDMIDRRASPHGTWIEYHWIHPDTGTVETNLTWLKLYGEYVFAVGMYLE